MHWRPNKRQLKCILSKATWSSFSSKYKGRSLRNNLNKLGLSLSPRLTPTFCETCSDKLVFVYNFQNTYSQAHYKTSQIYLPCKAYETKYCEQQSQMSFESQQSTHIVYYLDSGTFQLMYVKQTCSEVLVFG